LLAALAARGHPIVLPETPRRGSPLIFRRWQPGAALIAGRFGTFHPDGPALAPEEFVESALYRADYPRRFRGRGDQ